MVLPLLELLILPVLINAVIEMVYWLLLFYYGFLQDNDPTEPLDNGPTTAGSEDHDAAGPKDDDPTQPQDDDPRGPQDNDLAESRYDDPILGKQTTPRERRSTTQVTTTQTHTAATVQTHMAGITQTRTAATIQTHTAGITQTRTAATIQTHTAGITQTRTAAITQSRTTAIAQTRRATTTQEEANNGNANQQQVSTGSGRPQRPCPFCYGDATIKKWTFGQGKLRRHIRSVHKNLPEVIAAESIRDQSKKDEAYAKFRKQGSLKANLELGTTGTGDVPFHRERAQGLGNVKTCGLCGGTYGKRTFSKHVRSCTVKNSVNGIPATCAAAHSTSISTSLLHEHCNNPNFTRDILDHFANDPVGILCKYDKTLHVIGQRRYLEKRGRVEKTPSIHNSIRTEMRRLGGLYLEMKLMKDMEASSAASSIEEGNSGSLMDIYHRRNIDFLESAIVNMTLSNQTNEVGQPTIKAGLKHDLRYLIQTSADILKGAAMKVKDTQMKLQITEFLECYHHEKKRMFSDAQYAISTRRMEKLRAPERLPKEDDVQKFHQYVTEEIHKANDPYILWTPHVFNIIRDLLVSRITLFNGRRGGEPSRMLITHWQDASSGKWIPEATTVVQDALEKRLLQFTKIAYMPGKGSRLVSVLMPEDTLPLLNQLVDPEIRRAAGVNPNNPYLFPHTQQSPTHVCGWKSLQRVLSKAGVANPTTMTATAMRHRISTLYAALDVPEEERRHMYAHLGHSELINQNTYQSPLAVVTVTKIGKHLQELQSGANTTPCTAGSQSNTDEIFVTSSSTLESTQVNPVTAPSTSQTGVSGMQRVKGVLQVIFSMFHVVIIYIFIIYYFYISTYIYLYVIFYIALQLKNHPTTCT